MLDQPEDVCIYHLFTELQSSEKRNDQLRVKVQMEERPLEV
jgi:hypothetical protein